MGRYLAGDSLPEDTLKQLEKHISGCENCQRAAEDKRISLEELLHKEPEQEPEPEPEPAVDLEVAELDDSTIMAALATAIPMPEPEPAPEPEPQPAPAPEPAPAVEASDDPFADLMQAIPPEIEEFEAEDEPPALELAEAIEALEPTPEPVAAIAEPEPEPVAEPVSGGRTITIHIPDLKTLLADKKKVLILGGGLVAVLGGMSFMMKSMKPAIGTKVLAAKDAGLHEEEEHAEEKATKEEKPKKEESKKPEHGDTKKKPETKPAANEEKPKPAPETKPAAHVEKPKPAESGAEEFEVAKSDGTVAKAAVVPGKGVQKTPIQPSKPAVSKPAPTKRWTFKRRYSRPVRRKAKSAKKSFVKVYGVTVRD